LKESYVDVRREDIDVAEGHVPQTCDRTAVMQEFPDFVSAFSHYFKPLTRDRTQFARRVLQPRVDGGIPLDAAVESE